MYRIVKVIIDMYDMKYKVKDLEQKIDMLDIYMVQYRKRVERVGFFFAVNDFIVLISTGPCSVFLPSNQ